MNSKSPLDKLSPKQKQFGLISLVVLILFFIIELTSDGNARRTRHKPEEAKNEFVSVLGGGDSRAQGMSSLAAEVENIQAEQVEKDKQIANLHDQIEKMKKDRPPSDKDINFLMSRVKTLETQMDEVAKENNELKKEVIYSQKKAYAPSRIVGNGSGNSRWLVDKNGTLHDVFSSQSKTEPKEPINVTGTKTGKNATMGGKTSADKANTLGKTSSRSTKIVFSWAKSSNATTEEHQKDEKLNEINKLPPLPIGTMTQAVMLTGLDVPTGDSAKETPYPALLRIKKLSILPNRFRADLRECFLTVSGYGDISSERAYLRGEKLSCVRDSDGATLEADFKAFAIGEDGKVGIRGRLVERQGKVLAKAALAGFVGSFSKVFSASPVPTIATTTTDKTTFQQILSRDSMQAGIANGAGSAMEKLADYWMKRAEDLMPILEIDATRTIELITNESVKLEFKEVKKG